MRLRFEVYGTPAPQGSHRAYIVAGKARVTDDSKRTAPWRIDVREAALQARREATFDDGEQATGPVHVSITFRFPHLSSHYGTGRNARVLKPSAPKWQSRRPDIDKLARACLDALTEAGCWRDDGQVARLTLTKVYDHEAVTTITIEDMP